MKENCLDIGIVQAFMDGELPHDQIAGVSDHLERCDSCVFMLSEAEDQASLVFSALDREFNSLVPTQRLWSKINESIEIQHASRPFWQKAQAFFATAFTNPTMVAAAGLLIAVGTLSLIFLNDQDLPANVASLSNNTPTSSQVPSVEPARTNVPITVSSKGDAVVTPGPRIERAVYQSRALAKSPAPSKAVGLPASGYIDAEQSYVKTISSLSRTVEDQKDEVLRPSERVSFERDMALVNDTISKMRKEVKRNPRNESAKQVLYSSYQNKIDLLNSVSQKEELVASLK
jgi:anti-sigma factor RsiW